MSTTSKLSTLIVNTAAFLLHYLKDSIEALSTEFSLFVEHGMMLSKRKVYKEDSCRKKKWKVQFEEGLAKDKCSVDPGQTKFRRNLFLSIIDKLINALIQRADAYSAVCNKLFFSI